MKSRYGGNKFSAVDINGNLWSKRSELMKHINPSAAGKKKGNDLKKVPVKSKYVECANANINELSTTENDFSTKKTDLLTEKQGLSTPGRRVKENRINKQEVRARILAMINTERGKKELYFWTVTFPAHTSDDMAFRIYNIWLTSLRKYKMLKNYIWIAERQTGERLKDATKTPTNTIHFHLAIPHKMNVKRANQMMQGTLKTFAIRGEIPFHPNQCRRYNGVDIAKNRNTKRVANFAIKKGSRALTTYLTKYIAKNDAAFPHLAWHNSRGYSSLFTSITLTVPEFENFELLPLMHQFYCRENEHFIFVPWWQEPPPWFTRHLYQINSHLQSLLN